MKRATYQQEQSKYRLKDGIGFLHPFEDAVNLLGQYEELFTELLGKRLFWIIHTVYGVPAAIPVTVLRVNNGCLDVEWRITESYEEEIEEVDITSLYNSQEEAERVIRARLKEERRCEKAEKSNVGAILGIMRKIIQL